MITRTWIRFSGSFTALALGVLTLLCITVSTAPALERMDASEMSSVSGREGLAIDISLDASVNTIQVRDRNGYNNSGNSGRLILHDLSFNDGAGNPASLTGMTINATSSPDQLVVGAPSGQFSANVFSFCLDNFDDSDCDGRFATDQSFGELNADGISFANSEVRFSGLSDGLSAGVDLNATVNKLEYSDHNGEAGGGGSGNVGTLQFSNFEIGERGGGGAVTLDRPMTINSDATNGLVIEPPSEPAADNSSGGPSNLDLEIDNLYLDNPSGASVGKFWIENFTTTAPGGQPTRLNVQGNGGGITLSGQAFFNAHRIAYEDDGNIAQLGATFGGGEFRIHDGSDNPFTFNDFTLDIEDQKWIVADIPSDPFTVDIPHVDFGNGNPGIEFNLNDFQFGFGDSNETTLRFEGRAEGIKAQLDLELNIASIDLVDKDGLGGGDNGTVRFGGGSNIDLGVAGTQSSPVNFTGITFDVDPNRGAVLGLPSESFLIDVDGLAVGSPGSFGNSMGGINIDNANFGSNSEIALRGTGDGLELGVLLNPFTMDFHIEDGDGWDGGTGSSGEIFAKNAQITVDDGGGNPATFTMNVDGTRGMVMQAQDATVDFTTDTVFLGSDQGGSPSPVTGSIRTDGTTIGVSSR